MLRCLAPELSLNRAFGKCSMTSCEEGAYYGSIGEVVADETPCSSVGLLL